MRELFDERLSLDAAWRIVVLQDQLDTANRRIADLERRLTAHGDAEAGQSPA
jgi:hypothetical protein